MVGGALAGELLILATHPDASTGVITSTLAAAVFGSLVPDIDHGSSRISSGNIATRAVGIATQAIVGHRGFIHTPVAAALLTLFLRLTVTSAGDVVGSDLQNLSLYANMFFVGYISHLVLDTLNPAGIPWLWPFTDRRIHIGNIIPRSFGDLLFCLLLLLIVAHLSESIGLLNLPAIALSKVCL